MPGSIRVAVEHRADAVALMTALVRCRPYLVQLSARRWEVRAAPAGVTEEALLRTVDEWVAARRLGRATVILADGSKREVPGPPAGR